MSAAYAGRTAVAVAALAGGSLVGACSVVLHDYAWGLVLGVLATTALLVAIPGGWWRRFPFAVGWFAAAVGLAVERPEGDFLVQQSVRGYTFLGFGVVVLLGGVVGLRRHPSHDAAINGPGTSSS